MKLRTFIALFILTFVVISIIYDNFYTKSLISGRYIYNYEETLEGPNKGDNLLLKQNGEFESDTWGKGTYKINGTRLNLSYSYSYGQAAYECSIYRPYFWGKPRISINSDLGYFFEKID
ncbi:MAG: hypothetical protein EOO91_07260 [Pedobacter sp.]|nr:MAG: hypothetical protein EOO91_07260 [Pedobacter sp.]